MQYGRLLESDENFSHAAISLSHSLMALSKHILVLSFAKRVKMEALKAHSKNNVCTGQSHHYRQLGIHGFAPISAAEGVIVVLTVFSNSCAPFSYTSLDTASLHIKIQPAPKQSRNTFTNYKTRHNFSKVPKFAEIPYGTLQRVIVDI